MRLRVLDVCVVCFQAREEERRHLLAKAAVRDGEASLQRVSESCLYLALVVSPCLTRPPIRIGLSNFI